MNKSTFVFAVFLAVATISGVNNKHVREESNPLDTFQFKPLEDFQPSAFSRRVQDEPKFSSQFHMNHLNIGTVWNEYRGSGVTVAIIDSGLNINHEDFPSTNISPKSAFIDSGGTSTVNTKTVESYGLSIINDTNVDADGHGTNVAGTIGAVVNGVGTSGVSPEVTLMVLKTNYYFNEINQAIRHAADNGANIINMSLGAYDSSEVSTSFCNAQDGACGSGVKSILTSAINYAYGKGVTIIAAAGNEETDYPSYPASNNYVIGVGALARNSSTSLASYSNYGLKNVDIVAPGAVYVADIGGSSKYIETQGTSFASPIVASAAALYKSKFPSATPSEIEQKLRSTAFDIGATGVDATFGYGRLDISKLLAGVPVTGVTISPEDLTLRVGDTYTLTADVQPSNADDKSVMFISNNDSVATVDEDTGLVTAIGTGTTTIGVLTNDGSFDDEMTITVTNDPISLNSISFAASTIDVSKGATKQLEIIYNPTNATNKQVSYISSNTAVATVNSSGVVAGVNAGTATITATSNDGGKTAIATVNVKNQVAKSTQFSFKDKDWGTTTNPQGFIAISSGLSFLNNGIQVTKTNTAVTGRTVSSYTNISSITLGYCTNASSGAGNIQVYLMSSTSDSGTLISSYTVNTSEGTTRRDTTPFVPAAVKDGYVKIVVNCTTNSIYLCDVTINYMEGEPDPINVSSVSITTQKPLTMFVGNNTTLTYSVLPANATNKSVEFTSSNSSVASVSSSGIVNAISVGTAVITVKTIDGNKQDTITVNVNPLVEKKLTLDVSNFKKTYVFNEALDLANLKATYISEYNVTTNLTGSQLTLVSGSTKNLGEITLVFSYLSVTASTTITVTNVGSVTGEAQVKTLALAGGNFTPAIGTSTAGDYEGITQGGMTFDAEQIRDYVSSGQHFIMISIGGSFYNTTSLGPISKIKLEYSDSGSEIATQKISEASSPIKTIPSSFVATYTDSIKNTSREVTLSGKEYFRIDVSGKNLQAKITITYMSGTVYSYTPAEQANAYMDYFMTATEGLTEKPDAVLWDKLALEFTTMRDETQVLIHNNTIAAMMVRYQTIISTYNCRDFIAMSQYSQALVELIDLMNGYSTCQDFQNAASLRARYKALSTTDKAIFDQLICLDDANCTMAEKLAYMEYLAGVSNSSNNLGEKTQNLTDAKNIIVLMVVILVGVSGILAYYFYCKKKNMFTSTNN